MATFEKLLRKYPGFERGFRKGLEDAALLHDRMNMLEKNTREFRRALKNVYLDPYVEKHIEGLEKRFLGDEALQDYGVSNAAEALGYIIGQAMGSLGEEGVNHVVKIMHHAATLPPEITEQIILEHILPLVKTPKYLRGKAPLEKVDTRRERALRTLARIRKKAAIRTTSEHLEQIYNATDGRLQQLGRAKQVIAAAIDALDAGDAQRAKEAIASRIQAIREMQDQPERKKSRAIGRYERIMKLIERGNHGAAMSELRRIKRGIEQDMEITSKSGSAYSKEALKHLGRVRSLSIGRSEYDIENYVNIEHLAAASPELLEIIEEELDKMHAKMHHANRIAQYLRDERISKNIHRLFGVYKVIGDGDGMQLLRRAIQELAQGNAEVARALREGGRTAPELEAALKKALKSGPGERA